MHTTMLLLLFVLFVDGVSGADPDETQTVREGDSVTLHTGLTEILNDHTILWKFGPKGSFISQIARKKNLTSFHYTDDVGFRGRLQVDQNTGSLIIRNTRERHSGQYQVTISRVTISKPKTFNVTVQRVASGTGGVKSVSVPVMEGEPVTLNPDPTQIHGDDLMLWTFEDILLAKIDGENKQISLNDADEGYRDRLHLDQTGSLTITNTKTTDSGHYHLQIRGSESSQQFILIVSQPGLSSGGKAGIVLVVLAAVVAAAAAGFIYHRHKISELQKQIFECNVTEGESVHLSTGRPKIERDDVIEWMFGDEIIAEVKGGTGKTHDGPDERFRDRLELNDQTGDLTIKSSTAKDTGRYKLNIRSSKGNRNKTYSVIITVRRVYVTAGESVHLPTDHPKIERDDEIQWRFGDEIIAEIKEGAGETHDDRADERFRDRLQLNKITGDLTIKNSTAEDAGDYKLNIRSRKGNTNWTYGVIITGRRVTEGESVHLPTDHPKIERDDVIEWRFGDEIIAEIKEGTGETYNDGPDGRFRDRLQLNKITGDLTIKNSTDEDDGDYKLNIRSSKGNRNKTYSVIITGREKSPVKGNNGKRVDESAVEIPLLDK